MSRQLIAKRGVEPADLAEVGLTQARASGRGAYDRFRERIIFPIRDANGHAVGLGGRYLIAAGDTRDHGPKYLNSPATPLFDKSRTLYLVDRAKSAIRKSGQAVIVEGYTDALMAHQAGFTNVVASLGTALTPGQVAVLTRYAKKVALAYDVDPAGQSAGSFGVTELNNLISEVQQGGGVGLTDVGVVRLPDGKDPDEVIRESPDLWREAVRTPDPILAYLIDYHAGRIDTRTADGRRRLVDAVMPTLRKVSDPVVRDAYLQLLARRSGVEERILLESLHRRPEPSRPGALGGGGAATTTPAPGSPWTPSGRPPRASAPRRSSSRSPRSRSSCSGCSCSCPSSRPGSIELLKPADLPSTVARELYAAIVAEFQTGSFERGRMLDALDPETRALAIALYAHRGPDPSRLSTARLTYAIDKCLLTLEADRLEERGTWNQAEQADAERRGDADEIRRLLDEERQINEARRSLDRRIEQTHLLTRPAVAGRA